MPTKHAQVILPGDLIADVGSLVGPYGAFLTEVIREAVNRRRLLQLLNSPEPIWKDKDHPELAGGSEVWVRGLRDGD